MRVLLMILLSVFSGKAEQLYLVKPMLYSGSSDASGAIAVDTNLFIVADDENNVLRMYRSDLAGPPVKEFDFSAFLQLEGKSQEADFEAATRIGDRAFWMGSHGRNKNGKERPNRGVFFATDIKGIGGEVTLTPVGKPCKTLLQNLIAEPRFARFHFAQASQRSPKEPGALNIEGLTATPDGHLLIGFRNPVPEGKALLVPLLNPNEVMMGSPPKFGDAIQLDFGGRGIRDIAWYSGTYVIMGGSYREGGDFRIYHWKGPGSQPKGLTIHHLWDYHPEAIIIYPQKGLDEIQILSDDGTRLNHGVPNKDITDLRQRTFRSFWLATSPQKEKKQ